MAENMEEKNTGVVLDENGTALDKDGNKKETLQADYLKKADIMGMISEVTTAANDAVKALDKVYAGASYSEAFDTLTRLSTVTTGGSHVEFARKNTWITNAAQRSAFLTSGVDQGIADKQFIIDFYKLVVEMAEFRTAFTQFLNMYLSDTVFNAYLAIRFENQMKEIAKPDDVASIAWAFSEFEGIYKRLNDAKIYDSIPVSKSLYSPAENLEMVLDYIDQEIMKESHLSKYLMGAGKPSAAAMNQLYIYDRETKEFNRFASRRDPIKRCVDLCAELDTKLSVGYPIAPDGTQSYLEAYRKVLEKMVMIFQKADEVIETFTTETHNSPYSLMHYDEWIVNVTQRNGLGTLSNPLTEGTNYRELAMSMISRFQNLAKTVAKLAPN